nr:alpha/beta hydrolase fold domain-containing protein [Clostridia bacterium]
MAINKLMLKALSALSSHEVDVKKNYKLDRAINELIHPPIIRPFRVWDEEPTICGRKIPVRIFLPEKERGRGIFLFFHGGGWVSGNIDAYTNACTTLADETGLRVLSVDYGLAPEHPFPSA